MKRIFKTLPWILAAAVLAFFVFAPAIVEKGMNRIARTGGVIGIGYWDGALCSTNARDFARSVVHVRDLVGIDHVGLGSDFDGATTTSFDTAGLAQITQSLIDAGLSDADIGKVMGGNVARVLAQGFPRQ